MDAGATTNADNEEQLQLEEANDYTEIIPFARDTGGSCTTQCVSRDWFPEVREVNFSDLTDLKEEPDDVCYVLRFCRLVITTVVMVHTS